MKCILDYLLLALCVLITGTMAGSLNGQYTNNFDKNYFHLEQELEDLKLAEQPFLPNLYTAMETQKRGEVEAQRMCGDHLMNMMFLVCGAIRAQRMAREAALRKMGIDDFTLYTMRKRSQPIELNNLHTGEGEMDDFSVARLKKSEDFGSWNTLRNPLAEYAGSSARSQTGGLSHICCRKSCTLEQLRGFC